MDEEKKIENNIIEENNKKTKKVILGKITLILAIINLLPIIFRHCDFVNIGRLVDINTVIGIIAQILGLVSIKKEPLSYSAFIGIIISVISVLTQLAIAIQMWEQAAAYI